MNKSEPTKATKLSKPADAPTGECGLVAVLRAAIVNSELSQYEIAKRADISKSVLSLFVSDQRSMTLETADKVAAVLGLTLQQTSQPAAKVDRPATESEAKPTAKPKANLSKIEKHKMALKKLKQR